MIDPALALIGGSSVLAGFLLGGGLGVWSKRLNAARPVCGCRHSMGFHVEGVGECGAEDLRTVNDNGNKQLLTCTCRMYDGPPRRGLTKG